MSLGLLLASPPALAHRIYVDVLAEPGRSLTVEAYYGDGEPAAEAAVRVRGEDGAEVATGTTDRQGRFAFQSTTAQPLSVEVVQAGHKGTATITAEELTSAGVAATRDPGAAAAAEPGAAPPEGESAAGNAPAAPARRLARPEPASGTSNAVAAVAGIALILAAAALWQVRVLSRRLDQMGRRP